MSDSDFSVTQKEAADFLNVSTKSISRYRKRGLPYKFILNPVTGKQEVRFRHADLDRWDEGRQLLATYGREGEGQNSGEDRSAAAEGREGSGLGANQEFAVELLRVYKDQIEMLRDQLDDMREQLARRDRQIDDLMRLMIGLQLEYKPIPSEPTMTESLQAAGPSDRAGFEALAAVGPLNVYENVYEQSVVLEEISTPDIIPEVVGENRKTFSREQLSASILRLRRKGKTYEDIARGLNRIGAATISGRSAWTALEVKTLLPSLVESEVDPVEDDRF